MKQPVFKTGKKRKFWQRFAKTVYVILMLVGEVFKYFAFLIRSLWLKFKNF